MSYLGKPPSVPSGTRVIYQFTATEGQTKFSGIDNSGRVLDYDPGYANVFVNGSILAAEDFSALDGSSFTINAPLPANTTVQLEAFGTFAIADVYNKLDLDSLLTGKVDKTLKLLTEFKTRNDSGLYYAYGDGSTVPALNAPPGSGNNLLTVSVLNGIGVSHYTATQNGSNYQTIWTGIFFNRSGTDTIIWKKVLSEVDLPSGVPQPWPLAVPPAGWLICNGQAFSISTYPELAVAYPSGVVPDLRGEFIRGWDNGRGVDTGRALMSFQDHAFLAHAHNVPAFDAWNNDVMNPNDKQGDLLLATDNAVSGTNGKVNSKYATGTSGSNETRPRNLAFNYIVRAR